MLAALARRLDWALLLRVVKRALAKPSLEGKSGPETGGLKLYRYSGFEIVLDPCGVLIVMLDEVRELGMVALEAQSQYGMRKLSAAAW